MGEKTVQFSNAGGQSQDAGQVGQSDSGKGTPQTQGNTTSAGVMDVDQLAERLEERIQARVQESVNNAFRGLQSAQSKMEARIRSEVESRLNLLTQAGLELNDQQRQAIAQATRQQIVAESTEDAPSATDPAQGNAQGKRTEGAQGKKTTTETDYEWVNTKAAEIMQAAGVEIDQDDPEAAMVDQSDAERFLASLQAAVARKQERLSGIALGRLPMMGGSGRTSNPIKEINDMNELYKMALKKK